MRSQPQPTCPTVLIVEDEPLIRLYEAELAEDGGFRTLEAGSADEALETLESCDDVHILLTDVRMPGSMDGLALAEAVRERWPDKAVVIASATIGRADVARRIDAAILRKPFTPDELIAALQKASMRNRAGAIRCLTVYNGQETG